MYVLIINNKYEMKKKIDIYIYIYIYDKNRAGTHKDMRRKQLHALAYIQAKNVEIFGVIRENTHI